MESTKSADTLNAISNPSTRANTNTIFLPISCHLFNVVAKSILESDVVSSNAIKELFL